MYRFGVVCMLLVVLNATGSNLAEENRRLERSNRALAKALRQLVAEEEVGQVSDVCPANGEWVNSGFTTSTPMQGMDSVNTCMNVGKTMAEGVKLSVQNGNKVYVCCVPRTVELQVGGHSRIGVRETLVGLALTVCPNGREFDQATCLNLPNVESKYKTGGRADTWAGIASGCFRNKDNVVFYNLKSPDTLYDPNHVLLCQYEEGAAYDKYYPANPPSRGCEMLEAKSCTGTQMRIDYYNRESSSNARYGRSSENDDWCRKQCEYLAIPGCCAWSKDEDTCWFTFDGEVEDNDFNNRFLISEWGARPLVYNYKYWRYAGMCTFNGAYTMQLMENKKSGCLDSDMGASTTFATNEVECTASCIDDARCNFATWNGVCRTFTQCTIFNLSDNGFKMWSKVNDDGLVDY